MPFLVCAQYAWLFAFRRTLQFCQLVLRESFSSVEGIFISSWGLLKDFLFVGMGCSLDVARGDQDGG